MRTRFAVLAFAILAISLGLTAADDPLIGTWKLNLAKSHSSSGAQGRGETVKIEAYGDDGIKWTAHGPDEHGKMTVSVYQGKFDGTEFTQSTHIGETSSMRRVDQYTTIRTNMVAGKVTTIQRRVVSQDGKTLTIMTLGTDKDGRAINNLVVFDRQ
ncbi:MAG: hypothetical protein WCA19_11545 [Candidatus Acidiferrales bacterium]